ncbi:MAG: phosphopantetheine-binding protein, partial [Myxococcales bacterium]
IFASAFPGCDAFVEQVTEYQEDRARRGRLEELERVRGRIAASPELDRRIDELRAEVAKKAFAFDRRFLFRVLSMGHSQFAELIRARGPNTSVNAACASTTQAVSLAEDWIQAGRCRRVIVIAADNITSDNLMEWAGSGFLATGAAATDEIVEDAATPFDRRRHGMIIGMGAASLVVESAESARERGLVPIAEVLSSVTANSAFHGTRLDIEHIAQVMEKLVSQAEQRWGVSRGDMSTRMVFVSHETYTPARGGSAAAEVHALRRVFGASADQIVVANTKGYTGHAMGAGIEDVVAVKSLETGLIPPIPNYKEVDPDLGVLNLSKGGAYPIDFALRLGAGFGSQISMTLYRRATAAPRPTPDDLGFATRTADPQVFASWLSLMSGYASASLEVDHRTLRIKDQGPSSRTTPAKPAAAVSAAPKVVALPARAATVAKPLAAAVAKPVAVEAPKPAPVAAPAVDAIAERVLGLVAEKTGYPRDMLALDLDLEADLGVDTVKQAEVFASIRSTYDIPRDDAIKLRDYPTLQHVIGFVKARRPDLVSAAAPAPARVPVAVPVVSPVAPAAAGDVVAERVLSLVAEKTGYPREMLALDLDLEADLGVDTVKQAEVFATIRSEYGITRDDTIKLRDYPTLSHVIGFVRANRPDLAAQVVAPAPVAVPAAAPVAAPGLDAVTERVLTLVSEKTGYPREMLALDLDLEADLGVDTVKQAEVFATIRSEYGIARDDSIKLRDYPTLNHVIGFVRAGRPDLAAPAAAPVVAQVAVPSPVAVAATAPSGTDSVAERVLAVVADKTGYPREMLALDLDLEADLGVDTVKQAEVFATIRSEYGIARDDSIKLRDYPTLNHVIGFVKSRRPDLGAAAPAVSAPVVAPAAGAGGAGEDDGV